MRSVSGFEGAGEVVMITVSRSDIEGIGLKVERNDDPVLERNLRQSRKSGGLGVLADISLQLTVDSGEN
jgi:hypothetical protein